MSESLGWLFIVGAALAYMRTQSGAPKNEAILPGPNTEFEVDVNRWKHNGEQPIYHREGNQAASVDEQVSRLVLAF